MIHLLLIILMLVVICKIVASPGRSNPRIIQIGLHRVQVVLAVLGGLFGGLVGYVATSSSSQGSNPGAVVLGIVVGFALIWAAMAVVIWIINGFLTR